MFTVRFPNGQAVTYNRANYLSWSNDGDWELYTEDDGDWIASIQKSAGAILETETPCTIDNPTIAMTEGVALRMVMQMLENGTCPGGEAVRMKAALRNFDARSRTWA